MVRKSPFASQERLREFEIVARDDDAVSVTARLVVVAPVAVRFVMVPLVELRVVMVPAVELSV